jgi:hypothetical protein
VRNASRAEVRLARAHVNRARMGGNLTACSLGVASTSTFTCMSSEATDDKCRPRVRPNTTAELAS